MKKIALVAVFLLSMLALTVFPMKYVNAEIDLAEEGPAYFIVFSGNDLPADVDAIIAGCGGRVIHKFPKVGVVTAFPMIDHAAFESNLDGISGIIDYGHDYVSELPAGETPIIDDSMPVSYTHLTLPTKRIV